jgi:hypothetical protein
MTDDGASSRAHQYTDSERFASKRSIFKAMLRKRTKSRYRKALSGRLAAAPSHLTAHQQRIWAELETDVPLYLPRDRVAFERLVILEEAVRIANRERHIDNAVFEEWIALRDKFHLTPAARAEFKRETE